MKTEMLQLDGETRGFAIFIQEKNDFVRGNVVYDTTERKLKTYTKDIKLFRNLRTAKSYVETKLGIRNPYDYKVWIMVQDLNMEIDFDDVVSYKGVYQYYCDGTMYIIEAPEIDKVIDIGYIVFDNDKYDNIVTDSQSGSKVNRDLYNMAKSALDNIVKFYNIDTAFDKIGKDRFGHMTGFVRNTTTQIHILYNSQIMDLNTKRKDKSLRCIPYDKAMNKFTSLYIYCTKDKNDYCREDMNEICSYLVQYIVDYIKNEYNENCFYVQVPFNGIITNE